MFTLRRAGGTYVTSRPCSRIRPSVGSSKPAIMRSVVVFPQPEGPSIVKNSPSRIVNETSSTAQKSPNILVTASMTMPSARSSFPIRRYDKRNGRRWKGPVPEDRD